MPAAQSAGRGRQPRGGLFREAGEGRAGRFFLGRRRAPRAGRAGGGGGYSGGNASTTYNTQAYGGASYDVNGVSNNATLYTASINNNTGGYNVGDGFVQITGLVGAYASGTASASAFASVSGSASASASAGQTAEHPEKQNHCNG